MSETAQSSVNYENPSELYLSEEYWQDLADNTTFDETNNALSTIGGKENNETVDYTLSKEDFQEYFEGENFQQCNVGNCRLLSAIDSLVSFGDYEKLIRTSVVKDKSGFMIYLPLGITHLPGNGYQVSYNDIKTNQVGIEGNRPILVTGKQGIKALVLAYGKMCINQHKQFDYYNLEGGRSSYAFNDLVLGINTYSMKRRNVSEKKDPDGIKDQKFLDAFYKTLENFDSKYDMMTLSVHQLDEEAMRKKGLDGDSYSTIGHYSGHNHSISVEKVRKEDGTLIITVSNPWDSNRSYDITFDNLKRSCYRFYLGSKKERNRLKKENGSYKEERQYSGVDRVEKIGDIGSVNQVVQITGKADEALRKARGDIIVKELENNAYEVFSYGFKTKIKESDGFIIIYDTGYELSIDKTKLSDKYQYKGEKIENDRYPLLLYGAKIANFINMMRNLYINNRKRDQNNNSPFCIIDGSLQFDDDPRTIEGRNGAKREGAEYFGDDYIKCLSNWNSLGISSHDKNTQQKICNLLNLLVEYKKHFYG